MKDTILFDLDGTLINSLEDLTDATNYALDRLGYNKRSIDEVKSFVGNGIAVLLQKALPKEGKADVDKALKLFREYYNAHCCNKTKPYDGIIDVLNYLKDNNYKVGIVTNKPDDAANFIGKKLFADNVDMIVGASAHRARKPSPDSVDYCLKNLNSKRENAIYIGDSEVDVQTAQNSCLTCIGVTWGFRSVDYLKGADYIVDNSEQLKKIIASIS